LQLNQRQNERSEGERGGSKAWNSGTVLGERSESLSGEAPLAYASGGGDASQGHTERSEIEGEAPLAYACGGGDASPINRARAV